MAVVEVTMPQLGESVTEGTLNEWLVKPGDKVKKYQALCEVVTEKVNAEVPATAEGTIGELLVEQGDTVLVGTPICMLETTQSGTPQKAEAPKAAPKSRFSPAVMNLASEHKLDLEEITGTGAGGRITRKDVLNLVADRGSEEDIQTVAAPVTSEPAANLDPIRRTIARRMVESSTTIPHAWTMVEADVTGLVGYRKQQKDPFYDQQRAKLTYMPFFIQAVIQGLKQYPQLNSSWQQDSIVQNPQINISIAVATERALFVPVIKQADRYSLTGLVHELDRVIQAARSGTLSASDIEGGSFTVNNTGSFGSIASMPLINPPQAGIITLEAIKQRPMVIDNMLAIRSMVNLCLSFDHRLLDGLIAGNFLRTVVEELESTPRGSF